LNACEVSTRAALAPEWGLVERRDVNLIDRRGRKYKPEGCPVEARVAGKASAGMRFGVYAVEPVAACRLRRIGRQYAPLVIRYQLRPP